MSSVIFIFPTPSHLFIMKTSSYIFLSKQHIWSIDHLKSVWFFFSFHLSKEINSSNSVSSNFLMYAFIVSVR